MRKLFGKLGLKSLLYTATLVTIVTTLANGGINPY
jgi:hypothetical protein